MFFFFFKQKTAYEMRISDWSSDVCSSDLRCFDEQIAGLEDRRHVHEEDGVLGALEAFSQLHAHAAPEEHLPGPAVQLHPVAGAEVGAAVEIGRASWRESVCQYG